MSRKKCPRGCVPAPSGLGELHTPKCSRGEVPVCTPRHMVPGLSGLDGVRKIETVSPRVNIYKDSDNQEFIVKVKGMPDADYFTNDKRDAEATALDMAARVDGSRVVPVVYADARFGITSASGRWTLREGETVFAIPHISPFAFVSQNGIRMEQPPMFTWRRGRPFSGHLAKESIPAVMVAFDEFLAGR